MPLFYLRSVLLAPRASNSLRVSFNFLGFVLKNNKAMGKRGLGTCLGAAGAFEGLCRDFHEERLGDVWEDIWEDVGKAVIY